jgi:nucleotidyltransferase/DNA polymerase involved in DNA repair
VTRSHTAEPPTRDPGRIAERAVALLERTEARSRAVRLLGAGAHGLVEDDAPKKPAQDPVLPLGL